jgi:hypothetical protein
MTFVISPGELIDERNKRGSLSCGKGYKSARA